MKRQRRSPRFRAAIALGAILSLVLAQAIVGLTHTSASPDQPSAASHHGHSHADQAGELVRGHDAADHEHQVTDLDTDGSGETFVMARQFLGVLHPDFAGVIRDGPKRPPRIL